MPGAKVERSVRSQGRKHRRIQLLRRQQSLWRRLGQKVFAKYIADPKSAMPGNKMAFVGIKDEKDVADLIAYLKMFDADGKQRQ